MSSPKVISMYTDNSKGDWQAVITHIVEYHKLCLPRRNNDIPGMASTPATVVLCSSMHVENPYQPCYMGIFCLCDQL